MEKVTEEEKINGRVDTETGTLFFILSQCLYNLAANIYQ